MSGILIPGLPFFNFLFIINSKNGDISMPKKSDTLSAIELMHIGFNVSLDAKEYEKHIEDVLETARMFNSTVILRNLPDTMLNEKFLKKLKAHAHKIIIEV